MRLLFTTENDVTYMTIFVEEDIKDMFLKGLNKSAEHSELATLLKDRFQEYNPSETDNTEENKAYAYKTFLKGEQECSLVFDEYAMLLTWYGVEAYKTTLNDDMFDLLKEAEETITEHLKEEVDNLAKIERLIKFQGIKATVDFIENYKNEINEVLSHRNKGLPGAITKILS